jgi:hypothetical protein
MIAAIPLENLIKMLIFDLEARNITVPKLCPLVKQERIL